MSQYSLLVFVICFYFTFSSASDSNGFSSNIEWIDYKEAIDDTSKPSMIILHKSWCPACKSLKPKLIDSLEFEELSSKFSMVNAKENDPIHSLSDLNIGMAINFSPRNQKIHLKGLDSYEVIYVVLVPKFSTPRLFDSYNENFKIISKI